MPLKLQIIVAACTNRGIGVNNGLPWKLPGDLAFFRKVTSQVKTPGLKNAILMGRKTWDSIPDRLKPLRNRLNVVISRTLKCQDIDKQLHISSSFEDALEFVAAADCIDKIFIIGGSSIYDLALKSDACYNIFITKVHKEFQCDVFFPEFDEDVYKPINPPDLDRTLHCEDGIEYQFNCYHKIRNTIDSIKSKDNLHIYSVVAMDINRGIGYQNRLPWPYIDKDYKHYISLVQGTADDRVALIMGRLTWESMKYEERFIKGVTYILVGSKKDQICYPELICSLLPTFDEAVCLAADLYDDKLVNRICFLGGSNIYKEAIESDLCKVIYVTRINKSYTSDVFMPEFEHKFTLDENYPSKEFNVSHRDDDNDLDMIFQAYKLIEKKDMMIINGCN